MRTETKETIREYIIKGNNNRKQLIFHLKVYILNKIYIIQIWLIINLIENRKKKRNNQDEHADRQEIGEIEADNILEQEDRV